MKNATAAERDSGVMTGNDFRASLRRNKMNLKNSKCLLCWNFADSKCTEGIPDSDISVCPEYMCDKKKVRARYPLLTKTPKEKRGWIRAGSVSFKDTPKSLYRFLYIWEPKRIDFSDMYKCTFAIIDLGIGLVYLVLYKYEIAAFLYVPPAELKPKPVYEIEISCGVPGTEDEEFIEGSKVIEEFEAFITFLEQEHDVYSGNNFRV